jgi:hypothetical protein
MSSLTAVKILADVPGMSVDQFVTATAAKEFIRLQRAPATVSVSFQDDSRSEGYQPELDLSLANAGLPPEELVSRFRFALFPEGFLRPFCAGLMLGSENPTRSMLEDHFDQLQRLALPACREFQALDESSPPGPEQRTFYNFAHDLVSMVSELITRRVCDPSNERFLRRLVTKLK